MRYASAIVAMIVFSGCRVPTATNSPAQPESIASFESFLGLRFGDTRTQVIERLGRPFQTVSELYLDTLFFVRTEEVFGQPGDFFLFKVTIDNASDRIVGIKANAGDYAAVGLDEPLLRFLGMDFDEIEAVFGEPIDPYPDFRAYVHVDEARGMDLEVGFSSSEVEDNRCRAILVFWKLP